MKKNSFLISVLSLLLLMQACFKEDETTDEKKAKENDEQIRQYLETNNITAERTPEGLYYQILDSKPDSIQPKTGNQVYVHYVGRLLNGTVFDSSTNTPTNNKPLIYGLNNGYIIPGFNQGVGLMRKGEKARIFMPSYLAYGNANYEKIPAYSVLQFDLQLQDVLTEAQATRKYVREKYPLANPVPTSTGLYYVSTKAPTGTENPKAGQRVSVNYRGLFLSGNKFDESKTPYVFSLGEQKAIAGFEEGVKMMKLGEKAVIVMPSSLAYGETGSSPSIPPFSPLVFELELVKIE